MGTVQIDQKIRKIGDERQIFPYEERGSVPRPMSAIDPPVHAIMSGAFSWGFAYTLTEVTSRDPLGWGENTKEDIAIAARRTITIVDIVAEALLTLV
jgi:hypothetical protein